MTKHDVIKAVTKSLCEAHPGREVSAVMVEAVLEALGDVAAAELLGGGELPLPGLGKLKSREIAGRQGRNPRTGEPLYIHAHKAVAFTACKALKEAMKP